MKNSFDASDLSHVVLEKEFQLDDQVDQDDDSVVAAAAVGADQDASFFVVNGADAYY